MNNRQGWEDQLLVLEDLADETMGESEKVMVCLDCWEPKESCACEYKSRAVYWPLHQAIIKLRLELGLNVA